MRTVERSELPSTKQATTLTLSSVLNLFMRSVLAKMLERSSIKITGAAPLTGVPFVV